MHRLKPTTTTLLRCHHYSTLTTPITSTLKTRSVIRFSGPDTIKYLQGLLTNDIRKLNQTEKSSSIPTPNMPMLQTPPIYAALLTPQGRFLYDFFLYKPPQCDEQLNPTGSGPRSNCSKEVVELFADVDSSVLDELLVTLKRYRLRSKVEIENVAQDFFCWQRYGGEVSDKASSSEEPEADSVGWGSSVDPTAMSASHSSNEGWQWFKDPRLSCLGFRGIFPSNTTPPMVEADKEADEQNYLMWRVEKGVAEGSTEIPKGEAIALEYNLEGLNAISFDKGCYVGQELVARTHHRGVIRKRLLPLRFIDDDGKEVEQKVTPGSEVIATSSGKKVGKVNTALGSRGLGLLRLEAAFEGSGELVIRDLEDVKVEAVKPKWWPDEWVQEYE
ncbi:hypothetical protein ACFE04_013580 [Oxalis oulophora]